MNEIGINFLSSLVFTIPQLLILAICIYYLARKITAAGILLCIGSFFGLLSMLFNSIGVPYLIRENMIDIHSGSVNLFMFTGLLSFIFTLSFAAGLLLLVVNALKAKSPVGN